MEKADVQEEDSAKEWRVISRGGTGKAFQTTNSL
jgi:hypothetical protein